MRWCDRYLEEGRVGRRARHIAVNLRARHGDFKSNSEVEDLGGWEAEGHKISDRSQVNLTGRDEGRMVVTRRSDGTGDCGFVGTSGR